MQGNGFDRMEISNLYKIEFYVPESHLEIAKEAMFAAGAGRVGLMILAHGKR